MVLDEKKIKDVTGADSVKKVLRDIRECGTHDQEGDRDVTFYTRGWNMAMQVAITVLQDFVMLKEVDENGL